MFTIIPPEYQRLNKKLVSHSMGVTKKKNLTIKSTTDQIKVVIVELEQFLENAGLVDQLMNETSLALSEIVANAIIHGNRKRPDKNVEISFLLDAAKIKIDVEDSGQGFDPNAIPNPMSEENRMKTSGRGIYLAKASMDDVKIKSTSKGTRVELTKYYKK